MTTLRPQSLASSEATRTELHPVDNRSIVVQSTDGRRNVFQSSALDANYVTRERPDGSLEVAIVVTDASGELKEFTVRRYAHNEVHHQERVDS